jgi:hypothetical protein
MAFAKLFAVTLPLLATLRGRIGLHGPGVGGVGTGTENAWRLARRLAC